MSGILSRGVAPMNQNSLPLVPRGINERSNLFSLISFDDATWRKYFTPFLISLNPNLENGQEFGHKSAVRRSKFYLTKIVLPFDHDRFLGQTAKQWDTVIKEARATDKLPAFFKAVQYRQLGEVVRNETPESPSLVWRYRCFIPEDHLIDEMTGLPVPLEDYAERRRKELYKRKNTAERAARNIKPRSVEHRKRHLSSRSFDPMLRMFGSPTQTYKDVDISTAPPTYSVYRPFSGYDSWYNRADEEHKNDYIVLEGIGRVPVNQETPVPDEPVGEMPVCLSPGNRALINTTFPLQGIMTTEKNIKVPTTKSTSATSNEDEGSTTLKLEWAGETRQAIMIFFYGSNILFIPFSEILEIKLNREAKKLFCRFRTTVKSKSDELIADLSPSPMESLGLLQVYCYAVVRDREPWGRSGGIGSEEFFNDKTTNFLKLHGKVSSQKLRQIPPSSEVDYYPKTKRRKRSIVVSNSNSALPKKPKEVKSDNLFKGTFTRPQTNLETTPSRPPKPSNFDQHPLREINNRGYGQTSTKHNFEDESDTEQARAYSKNDEGYQLLSSPMTPEFSRDASNEEDSNEEDSEKDDETSDTADIEDGQTMAAQIAHSIQGEGSSRPLRFGVHLRLDLL